MARHLLIATATSKYDHLKPEDERPQLSKVLASVVDLFTRTLKRYERELNGVAENPPSNVLRKDLDRWFAAAHRDPADWVVVYYTGHADVVGSDSLYLLTSDFEPNQYVGTAFSLQQFADLVLASSDDGAPRRVQNLLLIVDTCFAGKGTVELTGRLASAFRKTSGSSFYLLGAALPRQEAQAGALAEALISSIEELSKRYVMQEWLYFEQVVPAINRLLEVRGVQRAVLSSLDAATEDPKFFPNPSYLPTDRKSISANEAVRAISDQEFRDHWGPRSRGVEFDSDLGSYFAGRKAVLNKLGAFLQGRTDNAMRIVTGRPGSGKSAILSRLVSMSRIPYDGNLRSDEVAPIDLAVHAKGKSVADVTARLAKVLDVEPKTEAIFGALKRRSKPLRIVVDALDESTQPTVLATELLRPLNSIDSVKLVVGTRSSQLAALEGAEVIDVDASEYADRDDIAGYVKARLLREDEPETGTPYAGKQHLAERIAAIVAQKAYPNFLVARLAVEDLLSRTTVANPTSAEDMTFPISVSAALNAYIARFGDKEQTIRDLLLPLAYAQGQGLPWDNIWAPLASAISRRKYHDDDLRWLLASAGAFILESSEDGRSVYRLYHQALSDALRSGTRAASVHRRFVKVLTASVPRRADNNDPDWLLANRYARFHLATHAAGSGSLKSLLNDPLYLLAADPGRLLAAIWARWNDVPRDLVGLYVEAVRSIRQDAPAVAACHLELVARKRNLSEFAERVVDLPLPRPCNVPWARWIPQPPSHSFGYGESEITSLAVAEWEASRIVALVGRQNGAVEAWDIASGERLVRWKPDGLGYVRHLALSKTNHGPDLLAAWSEGRFGIFDSAKEEGTVKVEAAAKDADEVSALCVTERNGENVCVTAHNSKRLVVRSLPTLTPILEKADAGRIYDLQPVTGGLGNTFLSVGDFFRSKMEPPDFVSTERDPSVLKLWSSDDLSLVWEDRRNRDELLTHVEEAVLFGRKLILAFRAHGGPSEIWDFETRKLAFFDNRRTWRTWLYEFNGEPLLVSVLVERLFARRLARDADDRAFTLVAKDVGRPIVMPGEGFSNIFRLRGRASILNAVLDRVRVWDLDDLLTEATRDEKIDRTKAPEGIIVPRVGALVAAAGGELYGASRTKVFAVDAATGTLRWERDLGGTDPIVQLQLARNDEWLVAGTHAGVLHLLDGSSQGATLRTIQAGESLRRFECFRWRGLDLAFATVSARNVWAARLWDLNTGLELPTNEAFQLQWGEEDKPLTGLAVSVTERAVRLAFASRYGKVMVARYDGTEPAKTAFPRHYQEWPFPNAENEYIESLATDTEGDETLLAAGSEEGRLAIWNFDNGKVKASHSQAHVGRVNALSFGNFLGQKVLVSGGADGTLRLWTLGLAELLRLDLGEPIGAIAPAGVERLAVGGEGGLAAFQFPKRSRRSSLDGL